MTPGAASSKGPTGAEQLLRAASDAGVEVCFANPGTSEMHFVSALDTVGGMRPILGLHETVCTGAADGYGRMAGRPALTLLHLGPGLANGLANLHNAARAGTPLVNLVGDMATWHRGADPLLNMDIESLAASVSKVVLTCGRSSSSASGGGAAGGPSAAMATAVAQTRLAATVSGSRVATLIVPHDVSWEHGTDSSAGSAAAVAGAPQPPTPAHGGAEWGLDPGAAAFVRECAAALRACPRGKAALYIGGRAVLAEGSALHDCGRVAAATGAVLFCENAFARLDRGAGRPSLRRLPYFPHDAAAALAAFQLLVLVDVRRPVANFGYEGGPSQLVAQPDDAVWEFDSTSVDVALVLRLLCTEVGGDRITPGVNCRGAFCSAARPPTPAGGRLTAPALCQAVASLQPPEAIIVDESLTSGNGYWDASAGCPPFSHLTLTGGAIGAGIPLAVGAAVACPGRTVINLQADGSGLYSAQGLWTQAREQLHVVTIVCANRAYAILKVEMAKQKISPASGPAAKALTELGRPPVDWVALATGFGVPASRVATTQELCAALAAALARPGPSLIEAVL